MSNPNMSNPNMPVITITAAQLMAASPNQQYFPGRGIPTEILSDVLKYADKETVISARLVSKTWSEVAMAHIYQNDGLPVSLINGMDKFTQMKQCEGMKSNTFSIEFTIGFIDVERLGSWILSRTSSKFLSKMEESEKRSWMVNEIAKVGKKYMDFQLKDSMLPFKTLESLSIRSPEQHLLVDARQYKDHLNPLPIKNTKQYFVPRSDEWQDHLYLLKDPEMDQVHTQALEQWASLATRKTRELLVLISHLAVVHIPEKYLHMNLPTPSIALKHLQIDAFPIDMFVNSDSTLTTDGNMHTWNWGSQVFPNLESLTLGIICCRPLGNLKNAVKTCEHSLSPDVDREWCTRAVKSTMDFIQSFKKLKSLDLEWQISELDDWDNQGCLPRNLRNILEDEWKDQFCQGEFEALERLRLAGALFTVSHLLIFLLEHKDTIRYLDLGPNSFHYMEMYHHGESTKWLLMKIRERLSLEKFSASVDFRHGRSDINHWTSSQLSVVSNYDKEWNYVPVPRTEILYLELYVRKKCDWPAGVADGPGHVSGAWKKHMRNSLLPLTPEKLQSYIYIPPRIENPPTREEQNIEEIKRVIEEKKQNKEQKKEKKKKIKEEKKKIREEKKKVREEKKKKNEEQKTKDQE